MTAEEIRRHFYISMVLSLLIRRKHLEETSACLRIFHNALKVYLYSAKLHSVKLEDYGQPLFNFHSVRTYEHNILVN